MSGTHDRFEALIDLYAVGGLPAGERTELEGHAASCASCGTGLEDARTFARWMRGAVAADAPPDDLEERVLGRFRAAVAPKRRFHIPFSLQRAKVAGWAAAAACLISLGGLFSPSDAAERPGKPGRHNADGAELAWTTRGDSTDHYETDGAPMEDAKSLDLEEGGQESLRKAFKGEPRTGDPQGGATGGRRNLSARGGGSAPPPGSPAADRRLEDKVMEREKFAGKDSSSGEPAKKSGESGRSREQQNQADQDAIRDNRKIIRNGNLSVEVEAYDAAYKKVEEIVGAHKGFVATADTQRLANGKMRATITLRIPPDQFDAAIEKIGALGTVRNRSISSQDVTKAYLDLEMRMTSKTALLERLKRVLAEGKGTVKELMEVEVQMGATVEAIESYKGELKYYDSLISLSTVVLQLFEKDLGLPFEYVQTMQGNMNLTVLDADASYAKAQKELVDAGGQVADCWLTRQNDGQIQCFVRGKFDAEKFPAVREALRRLGHVNIDTVNVHQTTRGGAEGAVKAGTPVRKEQAVVDLNMATPAIFEARTANLVIESDGVDAAYQAARAAIEAAGGRIHAGAVSGSADQMRASIEARIDVEKFLALCDSLRSQGKVKTDNSTQQMPPAAENGAKQLLKEVGGISVTFITPAKLLTEEHGLAKVVKETLAGSWKGLLWSIEKLFVGIALAGPWILLLGFLWILWRKFRGGAKPAQPAA